MLSLEQLYTDNTNSDANNNDDDNDDTNDIQQTNHDCIGSLACMPNKPTRSIPMHLSQTISDILFIKCAISFTFW